MKTVKDRFGRELSVGDYLLYPICVGRSAGIDVCRVLEFTGAKVKVGRVAQVRPGREEVQTVVLTYPERAVRISTDLIPREILDALR